MADTRDYIEALRDKIDDQVEDKMKNFEKLSKEDILSEAEYQVKLELQKGRRSDDPLKDISDIIVEITDKLKEFGYDITKEEMQSVILKDFPEAGA